jgi:hypothetical protein
MHLYQPPKYDDKGILGLPSIANTGDNLRDYLRRNIGWELTKNRDTNLAIAIQNPAAFLRDSNNDVEKLFMPDGAITKVFGSTYDSYIKAGLPGDIAAQYAMKYAKQEYDRHLDLLELISPGAYSRAFSSANIQHEAAASLANIATEGVGETVAEYKARKKAKKAQKALGQ